MTFRSSPSSGTRELLGPPHITSPIGGGRKDTQSQTCQHHVTAKISIAEETWRVPTVCYDAATGLALIL